MDRGWWDVTIKGPRVMLMGPGIMGNGLTAALMAVKGSNSNGKGSGVVLLAGEGSTKEERAQKSDVVVHKRY